MHISKLYNYVTMHLIYKIKNIRIITDFVAPPQALPSLLVGIEYSMYDLQFGRIAYYPCFFNEI